MFISLVRWFGGGNGQSTRPTTGFLPQLEALGARITPASRPSSGGDIDPLFSSAVQTAPIGDEVPTNQPGAGTVSIYASRPNSGGDISFRTGASVQTTSIGEETSPTHTVGSVSISASRPTTGGDIDPVFGANVQMAHTGEETNQAIAVSSASTAGLDGSKPGVGSGSNAQVLTEATDGIWVGSPSSQGDEVSPFGGRGGMSGDLSY